MTAPARPDVRPHVAPSSIWVLIAALAALGAALNLRAASYDAVTTSGRPPLVLMLAIFFVAEICVVHITLHRQAHTCSLSEIPIVVGLVFLAPVELLSLRLLGSAIALFVIRRQSVTKALFNLAYFSVEVALAVLVYRALLDDASPIGPRGWFAATAGSFAAVAVGAVAIMLAMAIVERTPVRRPSLAIEGAAIVTTFLSVDLGLVAVATMSSSSASGWLLLLAAVIIFLAYRFHADLRQRVHGLSSLYDASRAISTTLDGGDVSVGVLEQARTLLRAELAELVVEDGRNHAVRVVSSAASTSSTEGAEEAAVLSARFDALDGARSRILAANDAVAGGLGTRTSVIAAVDFEHRRATLTVADPLSDIDSFSDTDRQLLETFANHAAVALSNERLVRDLTREAREREHQALHDALSGLPNRTSLDLHLKDVLLAKTADQRVAVLMIDLDGFKEVNDTLGHHNGDELLRAVATRIRGVVPDDAFVSRMGGDEFAIVMTAVSRDDAAEVATAVRESLIAPCEVALLVSEIGASIGISPAPIDGTDAPTLLQRADVAMYEAKRARRSVAFYRAQIDPSTPTRLALAAELRRAIERHEILVQYQPIVALSTGAVIGVEALARWQDAQMGYSPPDVFVPVAEAAALIRPLTEHVLNVSLAQVARWREMGLDLSVAVNVSPRNLFDGALPMLVERALEESGVPPSALVLEMVETTLITESSRTIGALNRLSGMGISIAIDDFGTGYSSMAYLHRLPVDQLKIDKSFVTSMMRDKSDLVIVRSIIELGHNLGLSVTAEGVEDSETWHALAAQGCDQAQGYHLRPPGTSAQVAKWLLDQQDEQNSLRELLNEPSRYLEEPPTSVD